MDHLTDRVNVLIVSRLELPPDFIEKVAALDGRILVKDGAASFVAELRRKGRTSPWVERLAATVARDQQSCPPEDLDSLLAEAHVIYAMSLIPDDIAARAPKLRWIHLANAGIEAYVAAGIKDPHFLMTNGRGVHAIGVAEHTMFLAFSLARNVLRLLSNQHHRHWERFGVLELRDKVMGLVGLGAIGTEIAKLARGMGMKVIATKRSAAIREANVCGVDELFPPSALRVMLAQSDFVVIAAPLTGETKDMVGEKELRSMKPTAFLINVSRGEIVSEPALIEALQQGWIAGAGLDAFAMEPLPGESELWGLPNVILSPHMSSYTERRNERTVGLFYESLKRYLAGQKLLTLVDIERGY